MSEIVHVNRSKENGTFDVHVGAASIVISELRIRPLSNWKTPFQVLGMGHSSISLTNEQLVNLVAEYLRYSLCSENDQPLKVERKQVGWHFLCQVE